MFRNSQKKSVIVLFATGIVLAALWVFLFFYPFKKEKESKNISPSPTADYQEKTEFLDGISPVSSEKYSNSFKEWCQIDYRDLSKDAVFSEFALWLNRFQLHSLDLEKKDSGHQEIQALVSRGEQLALRRSKVLQRIIRGDPQKAIQLALSPQILKTLPSSMEKHLEQWKSDFVDIKAMHVCYDPEHLGGYMNRHATLEDGTKLRAWVYGKRRNLPSIQGLSTWGISLGNDFAISDHPIQKMESDNHIIFGGKKILYSSKEELNLFTEEVGRAEQQAFLRQIPVRYPKIATSSGLTDYYDRKYALVPTPSTWQEAKSAAQENNGTLVIIDSAVENSFIRSLLDVDQVNYPGFDESGNQVDLVWVGASDYEDENNSFYEIETNASRFIELNATEGDWKWLDGTDVNSSSYKNWFSNQEPNSTSNINQDYAAMNWSTSDGSWVDVNGTYRLPFVIEYQLEDEPSQSTTTIDGFRKVLVVPARFRDEGYDYYGSAGPLVNEFGEIIYENLQKNSYEPVSQENIAKAMEEVKEFFLRNSDGTFHLDAVIAPTVTIPIRKWARARAISGSDGNSSGNLFDSSGNIYGLKYWVWDAEDEIYFAYLAAERAALEDEGWDWEGPAFKGVINVSITASNPYAFFDSPPEITFVGGSEDPEDSNLTRQRFASAKAESITDAEGRLIGIKVLDSGAYYFSSPSILVNGVISQDYSFNVTIDNTCVSYVGITTNNLSRSGAAGVGYIGFPGLHVDANDGDVSSYVIAHELGHNFGLLHANRLETKSERPNSDESYPRDYGNPYSVMGNSDSITVGGDLTIAEKVVTKRFGNFGLSHGKSLGVDVAQVLTQDDWNNSIFRQSASDDIIENSFRIYRHDYEAGPLSLRTETFPVFIPDSTLQGSLLEPNKSYSLSFIGTGEGAKGTFQVTDENAASGSPNATLTVSDSGLGFSSEPKVLIINDQNTTIFSLDPSWIKVKSGPLPSYSETQLRNFDAGSKRGLRGLELKASEYSSKGDRPNPNENLNNYWLSYRWNASQNGISVLSGNVSNQENFLLDTTLNTPGDFSDAFLMMGHTFSDFDSDVHFTPVRRGGIFPMEYIDVVVNVGTVTSGKAKAPDFSIRVSNKNPSVGEYVQISVLVNDNNSSGYSYGWFINEAQESDSVALNQPSILKSFSQSGQFVVRAVVSDLKGGISSRNIVLNIGEYEKSPLSSISGNVRANQGPIEGARVAILPAAVIEHKVEISGNPTDTLVSSGINNPLTFKIDGIRSPNLIFRRGEIHRFYFDRTALDTPISFLEHPEHEVPRVRMNMLVTPILDNPGKKYPFPPEVYLQEVSPFANYFSNDKPTAKVGTILDFQAGYLEQTFSEPLLITRPYAKSLLVDTWVDAVEVSPKERDIEGNYIKYGGKGQHRDNPPFVYVYRSSIWEDYINKDNATAKAYVDGIGTISPVNSHEFYKSVWETRAKNDPIPELVIWGSGGNEARPYEAGEEREVVAIVEEEEDPNKLEIPLRKIEISDQGKGFEPNSAMAVLHYPRDPLAYWTFDRHETLFEESSAARYQPSPGWNAMQKGSSDIFPNDGKLLCHWNFDEDSMDAANNKIKRTTKTGSDITLSTIDLSDATRMQWGVKGNALYLDGDDLIELGTMGTDKTLSIWLKPEGNFTLFCGDSNITYLHDSGTATFADVNLTRSTNTYEWMHLAIVGESNQTKFFMDGYSAATTAAQLGDVNSSDIKGLIDETHIFSSALSEPQVKILGGRIFLDLSGNKIHAVPIGPDFPLNDPDTDPGFTSSRPSGELVTPKDSKSPTRGGNLGDTYFEEDHGRAIYFDDNDSYIDLSPHSFLFAAENEGTISFWIRTNGRDENGDPTDQNVFTAACLDDNASFFRIMLRDIGVMQLHAVNDGIEIAKFYTSSSSKVVDADNAWHHVALVVGEKSSFWIDGKRAESKVYASAEGENAGGDKRAFFSDIENLDYVSIGASFFNRDNNNTENFTGYIDDLYIYNRELNASEIEYLYELKHGREQLPRLEAVVDAVGTVKVIDEGEGYKETPDIFFTYGLDGNKSSELLTVSTEIDREAIQNPTAGQLVFVEERASVYSYHEVRQQSDWRHNQNNGWVNYELAVGTPKLDNNDTRGMLSQVVWTKDMGKLVDLTLPDNRVVKRKFLEYVIKGSGIFTEPQGQYSVPHGLFGYTAPPNLFLGESPQTEADDQEDSTAHALFFADLNHSVDILEPGMGIDPANFNALQNIRISGKGFRPDQYDDIDRLGAADDITNYAEYWGYLSANEAKDWVYTSNPIDQNKDNWVPISDKPGASKITINNDHLSADVTFSDWEQNTTMGEPRNASIDFNQSLSHVSLEHQGFGYSMPVEISFMQGFPTRGNFATNEEIADWNATAGNQPYAFVSADFKVGTIDENGSILTIDPVSSGSGYLEAPTVIISGGGGFGAEAEAILTTDGTGGIDRINVTKGGRGYFNIDPTNIPQASLQHVPSLFGAEEDGSLAVRLGGFLEEIPRCNRCKDGHHAFKEKNRVGNIMRPERFYHHLDAWVEIWDRNRSEEQIDKNGDRALAAAKIRNGIVEKVVVVKSGRGYIDPIAFVRAGPPHFGMNWDPQSEDPDFPITRGFTTFNAHTSEDYKPNKLIDEDGNYVGIPHEYVERIWRCANLRENRSGTFEECGHIHRGQYPPEMCPGEIDDQFPIEETTSEEGVEKWQERHYPTKVGNSQHPHYFCWHFKNPGIALNVSAFTMERKQDSITIPNAQYENSKHWTAEFLSRRCTGTKQNYVLLNDLNRIPYSEWESREAKIIPLSEGGRIMEIVVTNGGAQYASSSIHSEGSGVDVDVIPVFDERGENIRILYDDPRLKNLENDYDVTIADYAELKTISLPYEKFFPSGAGQGFQERPWSWDWNGSNNPTYGPREKVITHTVKSEAVPVAFHPKAIDWKFGTPQLHDNLGDRIINVRVDQIGAFNSTRVVSDVDITFNSSHLPDVDLDGKVDFIKAVAKAYTSNRLTKFILDEDATYEHTRLQSVKRSLYISEPEINFLPSFSANAIESEAASDFFRLNGMELRQDGKETPYFDLYVDDRLPSKFFYGLGSDADGLPSFGGEIIVTDGLPVMNWGETETLDRNNTAYTDQNGNYFIPSLEPGLYNVAVFLEDRKFQDSTFRPDSNISKVSDVIYIPGFPELFLETDERGAGVSRLIWAKPSRDLSRTNISTLSEEDESEKKILQGIGGGFKPGVIPELTLLPGSQNSNAVLPNIKTSILIDGTLQLEIIDDENTTAFNPDDRFSVIYSSNIQGVNFHESYQFSESGKSNWGGYGDWSKIGNPWMEIFPNDSNGTGILEIPLSTTITGTNWFQFDLHAYEANGSKIDTSSAQWDLAFDFVPIEGNESMLVELNQTTGSSINLMLTSTLRMSGIVGFEILSDGNGYNGGADSSIIISGNGSGFEGEVEVNQDGNITGVKILSSGSGYSIEDEVFIVDLNGDLGGDGPGNSARLAPVLGGKFTLSADLNTSNGSVLSATTFAYASTRNKLDSIEQWLDLNFDSIRSRNQAWWDDDNDTDGLSNYEEKVFGTHPRNMDTDGDLLNDFNETKVYKTNPHQIDTDGDGLTDYNETVGDLLSNTNYPDGMNPRNADTDGDGLSDGFEFTFGTSLTELSPIEKNEQGKSLGGYIFNLNEYVGNLYYKVKPVTEGLNCTVSEEYDVPWQALNGSFPALYSFDNLPTGNTYQISAFIDNYPASAPDGKYQKGEPSACWQGLLTTNKFSANLFLLEDPPEIYFANSNHNEIILPDPDTSTFSFPLTVTAWDLLDGEWDLNSSAPDIKIINDNLGAFLSLDRPNLLANVDKTIPLGTYEISYQATDSSGSNSIILSQTIIIDDSQGPDLVLLGENPYPFPYGSQWVDPGWLVSDNRDDVSNIVVLALGTPDTNTVGTFTIEYQALDSAGNTTTTQRIVQIVDNIGPTIVVSDSVVLVSKGQSFTLPTYSATDNLDGDVTSGIAISGVENVNVNVVGDYQIRLSVSDSSGNQTQLSFIIRVEPPAYAINGNAIDGYLVGAKVIFDADGDGQTDLSSSTYTEENGEFSLSFSQDELLLFDLNSNGVLDSNEGRIMVSGGVDSSTNEPFAGTLFADPNATVVTPLTSLIAGLMDIGLAKSDAEQLLSNNFSLPQEVDLTTFDPYENAANGEGSSGDILVAGARVATLMKQMEAFVHLLKGANYNSGEASIALTSTLATKLKENQNSSTNPLDDGIAEIVTSVINDQVATNLFTSEEVADFIKIVQVSDALHKSLINSDKSPAIVAAEITKQKLALKQSVLEELEGIENLQSVSSTISLQSLQASSETFLEVNLFAPTADDFTFVLDDTGISSNQEMVSLGAVDLDGDGISYSILSGNVDSDGDGIDFVQINQAGQLILQDAGEISNLTAQKLSLSISLSDSRGKTKTISGIVKVDNALVMESDKSSVASWMNSDWFGNFHSTGGPWIFHEKLGWQYVYQLQAGGFWFWDKADNYWWWTDRNAFPYAFDQRTNNWIFFETSLVELRVYDFSNTTWRVK